VGDMDWVCLALERKVCGTPQNMVVSLQVVLRSGKCVANGATIAGVFEKDNVSVTLKVAVK
jgi:hypothetical protein